MDHQQSLRSRTCILSIPLQFDTDVEDDHAPSDHGNNDHDPDLIIIARPTIRLYLQQSRHNNADLDNEMDPVNLHFRYVHGQESILEVPDQVLSPLSSTNQGILEDRADWRSDCESESEGENNGSSNNGKPTSPLTIAFEPVHLLRYNPVTSHDKQQQRTSTLPSSLSSSSLVPHQHPPSPSPRLRLARWLFNTAALALMCVVFCFAQWTIEQSLIFNGAVPPCIFHPSSSPHRNLTALVLAYFETTTHLLEPVGLPRTTTCHLAGNDPQTALLASDADLAGLLHPSICQAPVVFFDPVQVLHDFAGAITDLCACVPERSTHLCRSARRTPSTRGQGGHTNSTAPNRTPQPSCS